MGCAIMDEDQEYIIESCRNQISAIDREIFLLVKSREQLSRTIGEAKRGLNIPDRDFSREKVVFDRAIDLAHELDLPESFATSLQKIIIEASVSRQEKDRIKNNFQNAPKSVLVIGGAGRLGTWLCRFFADSGHDISVIDLVKPEFACAYAQKLTADDNRHDIIVVATPIRASLTVFEQLEQLNINAPIIFDVSSVKSPVKPALERLKAKGVKVTSLHPMFGPSVELLFGKHIIRTSLGIDAADAVVQEIFRATSLNVVDMSIEEHDATIAILLSLSHMVNLVFVRALKKSTIPLTVLERFSSPTFSNLLAVAKKVHAENPHLYFEIQALNPFTAQALKHLQTAFADLHDAVAHANEESFVTILADSSDYLRRS